MYAGETMFNRYKSEITACRICNEVTYYEPDWHGTTFCMKCEIEYEYEDKYNYFSDSIFDKYKDYNVEDIDKLRHEIAHWKKVNEILDMLESKVHE